MSQLLGHILQISTFRSADFHRTTGRLRNLCLYAHQFQSLLSITSPHHTIALGCEMQTVALLRTFRRGDDV